MSQSALSYHSAVPAGPALVEFWRGDIVESAHRVHACIVNHRGELRFSAGDPGLKTYLRSSCKPLQAMAVVLSGATERFQVSPEELALVCGSHGGEAFHVQLVSRLLAKAGAAVQDLRCGVHPPLDAQARSALERSGLEPSPLHHNCSGKHTGMMLTARCLGSPLGDYINPDGPVQRLILTILAALTDHEEGEIGQGIDGCSAPAHYLPLRSTAFAFSRLAEPSALPREMQPAARAVTSAMHNFPHMVAARQDRICTELMKACPVGALFAKAGAEGFYAAGWTDVASGDGYGMAVKVEDGAQRARDPVVLSLLQRFSLLPENLPRALQPFGAGELRNFAGRAAGEIQIRFQNV